MLEIFHLWKSMLVSQDLDVWFDIQISFDWIFDVDLEQFSNFAVPDFPHLQNGNSDTPQSYFKHKNLNPRKVECFA